MFKYTDFLLDNFNLFAQIAKLDFNIPLPHIVLPLALSFVTFQQIAFLTDCYKSRKNNSIESKQPTPDFATHTESSKTPPIVSIDFIDYCLFITFFPQLIAGPIVHYQEMMPQFAKLAKNTMPKNPNTIQNPNPTTQNHHTKEKTAQIIKPLKSDSYHPTKPESSTKGLFDFLLDYEKIAKGLFIFSIGLFKKTCIADTFAIWAASGMHSIKSGVELNVAESWIVAFSHMFEFYFDFSGYCDMAIGLGLLFGIVLPVNFNSPFKSLNIAEFWRRWHITLGRFLKHYVYIPLGGSRVGIPKHLRNLFIVFLLSGIWHGAGFGFIIWGCIHGVAICVYKLYTIAYKKLSPTHRYRLFMKTRCYTFLCWLLTFSIVLFARVFYVADSIPSALKLFKGMFFGTYIALPRFLESKLAPLGAQEIVFDKWLANIGADFTAILWIFGAFVLCLGCKNSIELMRTMRYNLYYALHLFFCLVLGLACIDRAQQFLYFNF